MKEQKKSFLMLVSSMVIFGTIGIFRRYIDLPSGLLASARGLIGGAFLFLYVLISRKKMQWHLLKKHLLPMVLLGTALGVNWILLFEAYNYTTVPMATLCYYMAPVFVILASPLFLKEKMTVLKWISIIAALAGMVLISGVLDTGLPGRREWIGITLGLCAAVCYAFIVILNKKIGDLPPYEKTFVQLEVAGVVMLIYSLFTVDWSMLTPDSTTIWFTVIVTLVHTGIAYMLFFGSIPGLPAQTVALSAYIDPVVALVLSAPILGETLSPIAIVGAVLIIGSAMLGDLRFRKKSDSTHQK